MSARMTIRIATGTMLLLGALALTAGAQEPVTASSRVPAAAQAQKGPLVFESVQNGMVGAVEVKFTEVNNEFGTMLGGYFGWLMDESFLIGGAGYWLLNGAWDREIAYGGLELGYYAKLGRAVRFGARGLIGGGSGTAGHDVTYSPCPYCGPRHDGYRPPGTAYPPVTAYYVYSTGFFVAEPQASFVIKLADWVSIDLNAGYRIIGAANGLREQLQGPTGGFAIRFGGDR